MIHKCLNAHCDRQTPPRRSVGGPAYRYCRECRTARIQAIARRNTRRRRGLTGDGAPRGALRVAPQPRQARVVTNGSWWLYTPSPDGFTAAAALQAPRMSASTGARIVNAMELLAVTDYGKERRKTFG